MLEGIQYETHKLSWNLVKLNHHEVHVLFKFMSCYVLIFLFLLFFFHVEEYLGELVLGPLGHELCPDIIFEQ